MKNIKQIIKDIRRHQRIIDSATRGQQMLRPGINGYTDSQKEAFEKYQGFIYRAQIKIHILKKALNP